MKDDNEKQTASNDEPIDGEYVLEKIKHKIETKYFVGQEVYIVFQSKFKKVKIMEIRVNLNEEQKQIQYLFNEPVMTAQGRVPLGLFEEDVYETKKDLAEAIMSL